MPCLGPISSILLSPFYECGGHVLKPQLSEGPHALHPVRQGFQPGAPADGEADEGSHGPLPQSQSPERRQVIDNELP